MPRCDKNSCSFDDAGCPVTEERMLERLACAESGDITVRTVQEVTDSNVRRHEGSKVDLLT